MSALNRISKILSKVSSPAPKTDKNIIINDNDDVELFITDDFEPILTIKKAETKPLRT